MNTIGFLGTGNMGTAILKGIAGSSMKSETKLYAYNPTAAKVDALASYGVQKCSSEAEVAAASQYLFLAIKPQKFDEVLPRIADAITEDTVLVSIAAGIGVEYIRKLTKPNAKVVLAMPNTPLLLGCGATALATEAPVSDAEFAVVRRIFDACGMTAVIEPAQMKEIIAINGSSPAFIYLFAKGFLWRCSKGTVCAVADRLCKNDHRFRLLHCRTDSAGILARRNDSCRSGSILCGESDGCSAGCL